MDFRYTTEVYAHTVECREPDGALTPTDPLTTIRYKERTMAARNSKPYLQLAGQRFGRLTALKYVGCGKWLCRCDCGNEKNVRTKNLRSGNSTSCGCLLSEVLRAITHTRTHGLTSSPTWISWQSMRSRCRNPSYRRYGGRGITICKRWEKFEAFLEDMGTRPSPQHSLGRINNDGNYEPGNCRWEIRTQQGRNKSNNKRLIYLCQERAMSEIAEMTGVDYGLLRNRISRGWSLADALSKPRRRRRTE